MSTKDPLRTMVHQAISTHPARLARMRPAISDTARHRADGAYRAYLQAITLTLGVHHPSGHQASDDTAARRDMLDALDAVLSEAAARDQLDVDAAQRAVQAAVGTQLVAAHRPAPRPMSMQERILGALTDLAQRAGWQVSIQPQYANTGRVYITAADAFAVRVELSYHFDTDRCALHFEGPAIEALGLHDSPPQYRYEHSGHGGRLSYHALRYADGERITAMLDLLTTALQPDTPQP